MSGNSYNLSSILFLFGINFVTSEVL